MANIRAIDQIARKWAAVTPQRATQYEEGVRNPVRDYAANTTAAKAAWDQGVTQAVQQDRWTKGVRKAGNQKWQNRAATLGSQRYGPGVQAAEGDYSAGFAPYREAIQGVQLPPRGPRRAPQNLQRVNAVVQAVSARKEAMLRA